MEIWAYCLMDNHVHFVGMCLQETSFSSTFRVLQGRHAKRMNWKYGWKGHLWEGRHYSAALDDPHLWFAVRYVELNPVRAGIADHAEDYPWSSARAHCEGTYDPVLAPSRPFPGHIEDWSQWLSEGIDPQKAEELRSKTYRGEPFGSDAFVRRLEAVLKRSLHPEKRGRPRKDQPNLTDRNLGSHF
jgi:putative transposase